MVTADTGSELVTAPRFEFRSFGHNFESIAELMSKLSGPVPDRVRERRSDEIYIMSKFNDTNNTKIRYGQIDIKTLMQMVDGLEQWGPLMKADFPVDAALLNQHIFPALQVQPIATQSTSYPLEKFLELIAGIPGLRAVHVSKQRYGYSINDTICEMARVEIDGHKVITIAVESTDIGAIKKTISELGMSGLENINYLQAIKRVTGMVDKPLAN
jgi:hypothetical protein